jgi:hypothetical protein
MTNKQIRDQLLALDRLYAEHAQNQSGEDLKKKNKLRLELQDLYLALKPHIKKKSQLQWYEPTYTFAITGDLNYIESVRDDLARMIAQLEYGGRA